LRTVLDLGATGDEALVSQAVDRGIADCLFSAAAVDAELGRQARRGRPGVTLLRRCLERRLDDVGERASALESAMDRVIVGRGLPLAHRQFRLGGTRYRLDYAWPEAQVAVEVDGYGSHSGLDAFCDDRARQNAIVLAGWTVLRFTWQDVRRRPAMVADQVRQAVAASRRA
jgi:very-short-patch-repair endonuclease